MPMYLVSLAPPISFRRTICTRFSAGSDEHLNRFYIHGHDYGVHHVGGISFSSNADHTPAPGLDRSCSMSVQASYQKMEYG